MNTNESKIGSTKSKVKYTKIIIKTDESKLIYFFMKFVLTFHIHGPR